jgi:hypothetical protein
MENRIERPMHNRRIVNNPERCPASAGRHPWAGSFGFTVPSRDPERSDNWHAAQPPSPFKKIMPSLKGREFTERNGLRCLMRRGRTS